MATLATPTPPDSVSGSALATGRGAIISAGATWSSAPQPGAVTFTFPNVPSFLIMAPTICSGPGSPTCSAVSSDTIMMTGVVPKAGTNSFQIHVSYSESPDRALAVQMHYQHDDQKYLIAAKSTAAPVFTGKLSFDQYSGIFELKPSRVVLFGGESNTAKIYLNIGSGIPSFAAMFDMNPRSCQLKSSGSTACSITQESATRLYFLVRLTELQKMIDNQDSIAINLGFKTPASTTVLFQTQVGHPATSDLQWAGDVTLAPEAPYISKVDFSLDSVTDGSVKLRLKTPVISPASSTQSSQAGMHELKFAMSPPDATGYVPLGCQYISDGSSYCTLSTAAGTGVITVFAATSLRELTFSIKLTNQMYPVTLTLLEGNYILREPVRTSVLIPMSSSTIEKSGTYAVVTNGTNTGLAVGIMASFIPPGYYSNGGTFTRMTLWVPTPIHWQICTVKVAPSFDNNYAHNSSSFSTQAANDMGFTLSTAQGFPGDDPLFAMFVCESVSGTSSNPAPYGNVRVTFHFVDNNDVALDVTFRMMLPNSQFFTVPNNQNVLALYPADMTHTYGSASRMLRYDSDSTVHVLSSVAEAARVYASVGLSQEFYTVVTPEPRRLIVGLSGTRGCGTRGGDCLIKTACATEFTAPPKCFDPASQVKTDEFEMWRCIEEPAPPILPSLDTCPPTPTVRDFSLVRTGTLSWDLSLVVDSGIVYETHDSSIVFKLKFADVFAVKVPRCTRPIGPGLNGPACYTSGVESEVQVHLPFNTTTPALSVTIPIQILYVNTAAPESWSITGNARYVKLNKAILFEKTFFATQAIDSAAHFSVSRDEKSNQWLQQASVDLTSSIAAIDAADYVEIRHPDIVASVIGTSCRVTLSSKSRASWDISYTGGVEDPSADGTVRIPLSSPFDLGTATFMFLSCTYTHSATSSGVSIPLPHVVLGSSFVGTLLHLKLTRRTASSIEPTSYVAALSEIPVAVPDGTDMSSVYVLIKGSDANDIVDTVYTTFSMFNSQTKMLTVGVRGTMRAAQANYIFNTLYDRVETMIPELSVTGTAPAAYSGRGGYWALDIPASGVPGSVHPDNCRPQPGSVCLIPTLPGSPGTLGAPTLACISMPIVADDSGCRPSFIPVALEGPAAPTSALEPLRRVTLTLTLKRASPANWFIKRTYKAKVAFSNSLIASMASPVSCKRSDADENENCTISFVNGAMLVTVTEGAVLSTDDLSIRVLFTTAAMTGEASTMTFNDVVDENGASYMQGSISAGVPPLNFANFVGQSAVTMSTLNSKTFVSLISASTPFPSFSAALSLRLFDTTLNAPVLCQRVTRFGVDVDGVPRALTQEMRPNLDKTESYMTLKTIPSGQRRLQNGDIARDAIFFVCDPIPTSSRVSIHLIAESIMVRLVTAAAPTTTSVYPNVCTRFVYNTTIADATVNPAMEDVATSVATFTQKFFGSLISAVPGETYVSAERTGNTMISTHRTCVSREAAASDPDEQLLLGNQFQTMMSATPRAMTNFFAQYAFAPLFGPDATATSVAKDRRFAAEAAWDYRCSPEEGIASPVLRDNCRYERCTGLLRSPLRCYFALLSVPLAECDGSRPPIAPAADCDVTVKDLSVMPSGVLDGLDTVYLRFSLSLPEGSTSSSPDFPRLVASFDLPQTSAPFTLIAFYTYKGSTQKARDLSLVEVNGSTFSFPLLELDHEDYFIGFQGLSDDMLTIAQNSFFMKRTVRLAGDETELFSSKPLHGTALMSRDYSTNATEVLVPMDAFLENAADLLTSYVIMMLDAEMADGSATFGLKPTAASFNAAYNEGKPTMIFPYGFSDETPVAYAAAFSISHTAFNVGSLTDAEGAERVLRLSFPPSAISRIPERVMLSVSNLTMQRAYTFDVIAPPLEMPKGTAAYVSVASGSSVPSEVSATFASSIPDWLTTANGGSPIRGIAADGAATTQAALFHVAPQLALYLPSPRLLHDALPIIGSMFVNLKPEDNVETMPADEFYRSFALGEFLCDTTGNGDFATCAVPASNCSPTYNGEVRCAQPDNTSAAPGSLDANLFCAFAEAPVLPELPVTSGCGALTCVIPAPEGSSAAPEYVPCDDPRLCVEGCSAGVSVTSELIAKESIFKPVCLRMGDTVVDMSHCHPDLVVPVNYAAKCDAKSTCSVVCADPAGNVTSCEDAWSSCSDPCRGGDIVRTVICSDKRVPAGSPHGGVAPGEFCTPEEMDIPTSKQCTGSVAFCSNPTVTLTTAPAPAPAGVMVVTWDTAEDTVDLETVTVTVELVTKSSSQGAAGGSMIVAQHVPVANMNFTIDAVTTGIFPGVYSARATFNDAPRTGESSDYTLAPACTTDACANGMCSSMSGACQCTGDWSGRVCDVSPCGKKGCNAKGSTCTVSDEGFAVCECTKNDKGNAVFEGELCETAINRCAADGPVCANGGTRKGELQDDIYVCTDCTCKGNWSGDECGISPCLSAGCNPKGSECSVSAEGFAQCNCTKNDKGNAIFSGDHCETPLDRCAEDGPVCANGGTRLSKFEDGAYVCTSCQCKGEWSGETCEISPCATSSCSSVGGECSVENDVAVCTCKKNDKGNAIFAGNDCEEPLNLCAEDGPACANGGTRKGELKDGVYVCTDCECKGNWSGETCEVSPCDDASACNSKGGVCSVVGEGIAQCTCKTNSKGNAIFEGDRCDTPIDRCAADGEPCANGGVRKGELINGEYVCTTCSCVGDWDGDECDDSPCDVAGCNPKGSECTVSEAGIAVCECKKNELGNATFSGDRCDTPLNLCATDGPACANGGTRKGELVEGEYVCTTCECVGEFTGDECTVDPCATKGCSEVGSTCSVNDDGIATCNCKTNDKGNAIFSGDKCERPLNLCAEDGPACANGGVRKGELKDGAYVCTTCACKGDWSGDECTSSPCDADSACNKNGSTCSVNDQGRAQCKCHTTEEGNPKFVGDRCDSPVDWCAADGPACANGGVRVGKLVDGAYVCDVCSCPEGFAGRDCESDLCAAADCDPNGSTECTISDEGAAVCQCRTNADGNAIFGGSKCSTPIDRCAEDTPVCANGGTRQSSLVDGVYVCGACACVDGYSGETCEAKPVCETKGCNPNGGTCHVTDDGDAVCDCRENDKGHKIFSGELCETAINLCATDGLACANGGTRMGELAEDGSIACTDCMCVAGWNSADDCESCALQCAHDTFPLGESCETCDCPEMGGFSGDLCECRHAYMRFIARDVDVVAFFDQVGMAENNTNIDFFAESLAADLAVSAGFGFASIAAETVTRTSKAGTRYHELMLRVGPDCALSTGNVTDERMLPTYEGIVALKAFLATLASSNNVLPALKAIHVPSGFFANDPNCELGTQCPSGWLREGMFVDEKEALDCDGVDAGHPDCAGGEEGNAKHGDSGLSAGAIAGIAVGGSAALVGAVVVAMWATGAGPFAASGAAAAAGGGQVQMAAR